MFRIIKILKDCLFPVSCLGCGAEGEWVCKNCYNKINAESVFCFAEYLENNLDILVSPYQYKEEEEIIGKIIQHLKYYYVLELKEVISCLLKDFVKNNQAFFKDIQIIAPVPLHARRLAERGFNQAEEIAKILGTILNKPVINCLKRVRYTKQQARLNKQERKQNVVAAFKIKNPSLLKEKVLLVDDVFTTGATVNECVKVLRQAGVEKILAFTLARG